MGAIGIMLIQQRIGLEGEQAITPVPLVQKLWFDSERQVAVVLR